MTRVTRKITLNKPSVFSQKLLIWAQSYDTFVWLDSNNYPQKYSSFDKVLAVGVKSELKIGYKNAFKKLDTYQQGVKDYIFGFLTYDLKNDVEKLTSHNIDKLAFPDLYFFQPLKIFFIHGNSLILQYDNTCISDIDLDIEAIKNTEILYPEINSKKTKIQQRVTETNYYNKLKNIKKHIERGDSYELNYCMEFYQENTLLNPLTAYHKLNKISAPPFAAFFKHETHYIISASPERFVRKQGNKIISQPIKGTKKRSKNNKEDLILSQQLQKDAKERAENIMIVDLVRNDLAKTATRGSVQVEELCQVYTFKQVHQLISTITATVKSKITPVQLIKTLFPMGSMTGAPKISSMKIIEEQETSKRGIYSGSIGYFTPENDFDFNVIIRSILYNNDKKYISYSVGGAITAQSDIKKEYQECLLKADAMRKVITL